MVSPAWMAAALPCGVQGMTKIVWSCNGPRVDSATHRPLRAVVPCHFSISTSGTRWPLGYMKDFELCLHKPRPPGSCSGAPGPLTLRRQFRDSKISQRVRRVSCCVLQPTFLLRCTAVEGRGDHLWLCREKGCRMQGRDRGLAATVSGRVVPIWPGSQT